MGFDAGLNTGVLLNGLCLASEVAGIVAFLYDDLITAAAESQFDCSSCRFRILNEIVGTESNTDGNRHGNFVTDVYGLHVLQNGELFGFQIIESFLSYYKEVFILLCLTADSVHIGKIFVYFSLNQGEEQRLSQLVDALKSLLVIVQAEHTADNTVIVTVFNKF